MEEERGTLVRHAFRVNLRPQAPPSLLYLPLVRQVSGVGIAVLLWEAVTATQIVGPDYLASPLDVATAIVTSAVPLLAALLGTLKTWALGLAVATLGGTVLGVASAATPVIDGTTEWLVRSLRSVPSLAFIPIAILFLGVTDQMQAGLVAVAAFWPVFINAQHATRQIKSAYVETARTLHLPRATFHRRITLPAVLPMISSGVRTSIGLGMAATISVELVIGYGGLGGYVLNAQQSSNIPLAYAGVVVGGIAGWLLNLLFSAFEHRWLHWNYRSASAEAVR
jgi:ABC-type nitrate/sulfonate/bicarbonate transport system permease component